MENRKTHSNNEELRQMRCTALIEEINAKLQELKEYGLNEKDVVDHKHRPHTLLPLIIGRNYKIYLGAERQEIRLQPLIKAVYFLFLRHPEGLLFKELPDYRKELTEIYLQLKPNGLTDRVRKSIKDVTDPTLNSINEKCARIRAAFILQFDEYLAKNYYIDGLRGQPKKIALPRDLVVWEE